MRCSSVFVSIRLKSLALLPALLPLIHYVKDATNEFGMERVFPFGTNQDDGAELFERLELPLLLHIVSLTFTVSSNLLSRLLSAKAHYGAAYSLRYSSSLSLLYWSHLGVNLVWNSLAIT
jgi:hypothetical protein